MQKVYLKIPTLEELKFRQEWMKDPKTMEYNAGLDVNIKGYNYIDGAFEKYEITELSDMIPENRIGAIKSFKKAGFVETDLVKEEFVFDEKVIVKQVLLTRE